ncbi:MAG: hypothetical protein ACD_24C00354G0003 [uncultured bacterium]|uniref:Uncharacterized protein n=1 Tax=candidate division WWE3 bacterium TaxID=2053526 RepID=A0A656PMD9_UNCKA|nr:hypothetical protein P147_WWE3C00001G0239 [candidate division WWE3 bacterium RAAC2_WWE3_1]EKD95746.1 MAG: hypothetical protein ACD_24C00354G0003 [uncultured bacterium]KKT05892.1 MAG: hypothetical protein UV83_C0001G0210 [candidate division WWE3 bacterium GW2011_GWE2_43_18]KKT07218.1 MAG: hypothetical protein UV84_C0001G0054 [candidate division WWE3 bacterium GW2011_GWF2_43_18]KKT65079.1 MAG: hypothetical protein UW59_C0002G0072 [candidate division WWE3 bacterium GW2011_GWC1_44_308]KKT71114.
MYSTFSNIKESFKLAWKHKMLWILVLVMMGGFNFNSYSNFSNLADKTSDTRTPQIKDVSPDKFQPVGDNYNLKLNALEEFKQDVKIPTSPESAFEKGTNEILGVAQNRPAFNFTALLGSLVMVAPVVLLVIFFWAAISFLISVWAKGALFSGLIKASNSQNYDFKDLGSEGKKNWKRYLKLSIYFFYKRLLSVLPIFGIGLIVVIVNGIAPQSTGVNVIFGILMLTPFLWALIYNISLYFVEQFALRSIIADNVPTKATFKLGWKYYKTRPGKSIKLALALILVLPIFMLIFFLPMGLLVGITAFLVQQKVSFVLIGFMGLLAAITGIITILVSSPFLNSVAYFSWTRLFLFIRESFDERPMQNPVEFAYKPEAENGQI